MLTLDDEMNLDDSIGLGNQVQLERCERLRSENHDLPEGESCVQILTTPGAVHQAEGL